MTGSKMLVRWIVCVLGVGIALASRASPAFQQHGVKGARYHQQNSRFQALESAVASEVEYVDGPLAPLYDFLIQRKLQRFCKLLRDAGLEQVIQDLGGSWTLFAPTDASFIFLPGGTLEELQRNPQLLRDFILYHFIAGDFSSSQIQNEMLVDSVQGSPLRFNIYGQILTVSGAQILEPDLLFELGRVYIIDRPLYPIPSNDIVSHLQRNYREIYRLLLDAGLIDYISSGTFTFLVPDDEAFNFLSVELKDALPGNKTLAERILLNHILPGSLYVGGITDGMQWETVGGSIITFTVKRGLTFANDIPIVLPDVPLTNGVIHIINRVLLPEGIENDCQCKPSSDTSDTSGSQSSGNSRPSYGQTQRPQYSQGPTTRRPGHIVPRPTQRPGIGTITGQGRPGSQSPSTSVGQPVNRPWNPPGVDYVERPPVPPRQVTQPPYIPPTDPNIEDDINSVVGVGEQPISGHKRPDHTRTTRYPLPPSRVEVTQRPSSHRIAPQPTRVPQRGSYPGHETNENYPEQEITPGIIQTTRQTDRWSNRQSTPTPRYPVPQRGSYRTSVTTRRPLTTRAYEWNQPRPTQPGAEYPSLGEEIDSITLNPELSQSHRPGVQTTSWQQRRQVTTTTRQPIQRPQRYPQPPIPTRRGTTARTFSTPSSAETQAQSFESNRQQPNCRRQGDRINPFNRNLPICPESNTDGCQSLPYNPADSRPLCSESIRPDCRDASEPYKPSDNRPLCPSTAPEQDCREFGKPTYVGDRRPLCPQLPSPQSGCKDPSTPYNPSDRRPVCRTTSTSSIILPTTPGITQQGSEQDCREFGKPTYAGDRRPLCPQSPTPQSGCKDPSAPYNPSDRRPVCRTTSVPSIILPTTQGIGTQESGQDCREFGKPTYVGDRRPICPQSASPQSGCKDPSSPYNPSDRRPVCRTTSAPSIISHTTQSIGTQQGCRRPNEVVGLQDQRPLCPEEPQQECRPFLERPKPGDRRPVCSVNRQQTQQPKPTKDVDKDQKKPIKPQQSSTYPPRGQYPTQPTRRQSWQTTARPQQQSTYPQRGQYHTQTTRRSSWQSTRSTQSWQTTTNAGQPIGKQPYPGSSQTPSQPQGGTFETELQIGPRRPETGSVSQPQSGSQPSSTHSGSHPSQPQPGSQSSRPHSGSYPSQPQSGSYPSEPQSGSPPSQSGPYPSRPHSGSQPSYPSRPHSGSQSSQPSQPHSGSQPQSGSFPSQPQSSQTSQPHSGSHPSQPHTTQGQFQPGRTTPGYSQRRPGSQQSQSRFTVPTTRPQVHGVTQPVSGDVRAGQPLVPHGRPASSQGHQRGSLTPSGRPTTARVPISVTGTTTPGEDTRRTLYEIVEDPALLIRGRPVQLTRIFSLFHKAGLENLLTEPGPTTVFLPSDDAFALLPQGVVEQLEENPELLRKVLLYHVTKSEILPSAQGESYTIPSLEGTPLVITMLNGGKLIIISGAKAVAVTRANNGIFYVINQLLYPLPHHDIVGAIQSRPDLSTLAFLLPLSGLQDLLQSEKPYTLLAPTDNAFAQLPQVVYDELTRNTTALQEILLNHVIEGAHYGREFFNGGTFPSARGGKLKFQVVSYGYQVNEVNIKTPEIVTGTGVIHLVDQVLLEEPDLQFFTNLENSLAALGEDVSLTNTQQPSVGEQPTNLGQLNPAGPRPVSGQRFQGSHRTTTGQTHVGGLQPSLGQPALVGRIPSHGQRVSGNQQTPTGPQVPGQHSGQTSFGRHQQTTPAQPQITGNTVFGGRQPSLQPGRPTHGQQTPWQQTHGPQTPGQQTRGQQTPGHQAHGQPTSGQQTPGQSSFGSQRLPTHGQQGQTGSFAGQRQPTIQTVGQTFSSGHQGRQQSGGQANDVAELARTMGLNQFANWISNTGLLEKIHDGGVYTVFAPTDDAVSSLPHDMVYSIESNPEQVKPILQYHIVPQRLNLNSITNEETSSTLLQGKKIRFNVYQSSQPNCKQLVTASGTPVGEALATMGSIQVIPVTQVLYQPAGDLLKIVEASPILQKLSEAVKSARLTWVLSGTGPFTIFAPSDIAFESLSEEQRKTFIEDKQAFSDFLKRHIVRGTLFSSGIQDDIEKKSENNKPIKLSLQEGILTVNSVPVTYADITATNGVLHVIDTFLWN